TVNALLIGPGVTINAADTTATLSLQNGPLLFSGSASLNVPYLTYVTGNTNYVAAAAGATGTVSSIIVGTSTNNLMKGGAGTVVFGGANQFVASTFVNQGILRVTNAAGLGSPAGATTVNLGAQIQ